MRDSQRFTQLAGEILHRGHSIRFPAEGFSMGRTIRDGETILVEPVQTGDIRRGDILLYRWERGVRAHRVLRIRRAESVFVLRGDAGGEEEPVRPEEILGRAVSVERNGRPVRLRGLLAFARRALRGAGIRASRGSSPGLRHMAK